MYSRNIFSANSIDVFVKLQLYIINHDKTGQNIPLDRLVRTLQNMYIASFCKIRVDAVIGDANWTKFLQKRHPNEIHILAKKIEGTSELTSIAVAKDRSLLTVAISMFLMQYNGSIVRERNYQKWFGEAETR